MYRSRFYHVRRAHRSGRYTRAVAQMNGTPKKPRNELASLHERSGSIRLALGMALVRFLLAPDWLAAICLLVSCPILQSEEAAVVLRGLFVEARMQHAAEDASILQSHLDVLEYAQKYGVEWALKMLLRSV